MTELNVKLRDVQDDDLTILFEHQQDPETVRVSAFPARERDAFMTHWNKVRADPNKLLYAITLDGETVGSIFSWMQDDHRELGYGVGRQHWGKGIATQALRLFLPVIKERPVLAYTAEHNIGSMRVLEKCGFVRVGEDKGLLSLDGVLVTEVIFRLD